MDLALLKTTFNEDQNRFELLVDGSLAKIDIKKGRKGQLYLVHTEVPVELENKGVGHKLVRESLEWVEKNGLKIVPLCPFVRSFVVQYLEDYKEIIDEGVKL